MFGEDVVLTDVFDEETEDVQNETDLNLQEQNQEEMSLIQKNQQILAENANTILDDIVKSESVEDIKNLTQLFNLNTVKKNALRINQLNELMDLANQEALERFKKYAPFMDDKDVANYMKVFQQSLTNAQQIVNSLDEKPTIQLNIQNNINTNEPTLSRESQEKVASTVKTILQYIKEQENKNQSVESDDYEIVDAEESNNE